MIIEKLTTFNKSAIPKNRGGSGYGKPRMPVLPDDLCDARLAHFVGQDSWFFFASLDILDDNMLSLPVSHWGENETYIKVQSILAQFIVTNDVAERAVKLASEKIGSSVLEQRFQNIAQVVCKDRSEKPNLRNNTLVNSQ